MLKYLILIVILSATFGLPVTENSLNNHVKQFIPIVDKMLKNIDSECAKNKLNLQNNGNKIISAEQGLVYVFYASYLCSDEITMESLNEKIKGIEELNQEDAFVTNCMKLKLMTFDPKNPLLDHFDKDTVDSTECENSDFIKMIRNLLQKAWTFAEEVLGNTALKCKDAETEERQLVLLLAMIGETRVDVKKSQAYKFLKNARTQHETFFMCIMKPVEDMEEPLSMA